MTYTGRKNIQYKFISPGNKDGESGLKANKKSPVQITGPWQGHYFPIPLLNSKCILNLLLQELQPFKLHGIAFCSGYFSFKFR